jgi:hypothetical protein
MHNGKRLQGKENKDFGPDTCRMGEGIYAKGVKGADDDEDGGPTVIQGEREMDEELITVSHCRVVLLNNVVDVLKIYKCQSGSKIRGKGSHSHCGANEEGKDKGYKAILSTVRGKTKKVVTNDIMLSSPEVDVDGIEDGKERKPPRDAIDNCLFAIGEELVNDSTEKKNVDERPL